MTVFGNFDKDLRILFSTDWSRPSFLLNSKEPTPTSMPSQQIRIATAVRAALAGATVLAANTRAARRLRLEAEWSAFREKSACETPDILPLEAWVSRTWTECLLAGISDRALLKPNVAAALWEQIVAGSAAGRLLLSHRAAAELATQAWELIHAHKLPRSRALYSATAETKTFHGWAEAFEERCTQEGWIDSAAALAMIVGLYARLPKRPKQVVAFGFDEFTPVHEELWQALRAAGTEVIVLAPGAAESHDHARVTSFADAGEEIRTAARWARRKMEENPAARIGVIVPRLEALRDPIETAFSACLHPENSLLTNPRQPRAFEISLGRPLGDFPMVRTALRILRLATSSLPATEFSTLLRSRYLGGSAREANGRARLDFELRRKTRATVTLSPLLGTANPKLQADAPQLFRILGDLENASRKLARSSTRSAWVVQARDLLRLAGWPGDADEGPSLNSEEFQLSRKWEDLLTAFGALDLVLPRRAPADLQRELEHAASETTFALENESAPIQIVGPLAASGESFDALWFCGLTDDAWPQRGHPNPFVPFALQKEHGTPHCSAEANLRAAQRVIARLLESAEDCVLSWPQREEDRELRPSPLLSRMAQIAHNELPLAEVAGWSELQVGTTVEQFVDERAPALTDAAVRLHWTKLLEWQSGCPFRAFAQVQLAAEPLDEASLGANPRARGKITELALQYVWEQFHGLQHLGTLTTAQVEGEISSAIDRALDEEFPRGEEEWLRRHREIERERLNKLIHEWLDLERTREPFSNVQHQVEIETRIGELTIRGRADRVEQTNDGAYVILDYKTGGSSFSSNWWEAPRPQDPQLPIYAVAQRAQGHEIAGVAFARVRAGNCEFKGEAVRKEIFGKTQNSKRYGEFQQTLETWSPELEQLGTDFLAGHAEVDPKLPPTTSKSTCKYCHLESLCRIAEIAPPVDEIDENDDE
jgi:probable DNA repair protein